MLPTQRELPTLPQLTLRLVKTCGLSGMTAAFAGSHWLTRATPGRPRRTPADLDGTCERLRCATEDGHRLAGWVVSPPAPRATVALFHGLHRGREQTIGRTALLLRAGFRCVAFDHRAHGESTGRRTSFGYCEAQDVRAVLRLVRDRWPDQPRAALGISMGAAALCFAAEETRSCAAVVLESLYHDIGTAFASRLGEYPPWFRRLSRGLVWVTEWRLGLRLEQLAPVEHIGRLAPAPVLLITGDDDPNAPPADARRLQARCEGPCDVCTVPHAGHLDLFETGGSLYANPILGFLERWLDPARQRRQAA